MDALRGQMPKTVSNRQLRRTVSQHQHALEEGFAPALRAVVQNEAQTRARVDRLEQWTQAADARTFWQRLRWIVTGM